MKNDETGWIEADITINGQPLSFAESLTLRVAIQSFLMFLSSVQVQQDLGVISDGYSRACQSINEKLFRPKP